MRRLTGDLIKLLKYLGLIVDQKLRETDHVHEEDMGDFQMQIGFTVHRHANVRRGIISSSSEPVEPKLVPCNAPGNRRATLPISLQSVYCLVLIGPRSLTDKTMVS